MGSSRRLSAVGGETVPAPLPRGSAEDNLVPRSSETDMGKMRWPGRQVFPCRLRRSAGRMKQRRASPYAGGLRTTQPERRAAHSVPRAINVFPFHSLPSLRGRKRLLKLTTGRRRRKLQPQAHTRLFPLQPLLLSTPAFAGGGPGPAVPYPRAKVPAAAPAGLAVPGEADGPGPPPSPDVPVGSSLT